MISPMSLVALCVQFRSLWKQWRVLHTQKSVPYFRSLCNVMTRLEILFNAQQHTPEVLGVLQQHQEARDTLLQLHVLKSEYTMKKLRKIMYRVFSIPLNISVV